MSTVWVALTSMTNHLAKDTPQVLLGENVTESEAALGDGCSAEAGGREVEHMLLTWQRGNLDKAGSLLPHL